MTSSFKRPLFETSSHADADTTPVYGSARRTRSVERDRDGGVDCSVEIIIYGPSVIAPRLAFETAL